MDRFPLELPIFLLATFAGAIVTGLSGFAFGLVVSSIWLYAAARMARSGLRLSPPARATAFRAADLMQLRRRQRVDEHDGNHDCGITGPAGTEAGRLPH